MSNVVQQNSKYATSNEQHFSSISDAEHRPCSGSKPLKFFCLQAHPELGRKIAAELKVPIQETICGTFSNGELRFEAKTSVRGNDCFVLQPICPSEDGKLDLNAALMQLLICISALKMASSRSVNAVIPIYGYARQDKKEITRSSITARLVADILQTAGVDRVITLELHASQIEGFFTRPIDNIHGEDFLLRDIYSAIMSKHKREDLVVVSPDAGGAKRANSMANKLSLDCAIISKERLEANKVASMRLVGNVDGKIAIVVDDMADTCGTLTKCAELLKANGAVQVYCYVVHGVFSGPALDRLNSCSALHSVVCTNSMPQQLNSRRCPKIRVLDISKMMALAIECVWKEKSILAQM